MKESYYPNMLRNLDKPPTPLSSAYLQADFIEMLCLAQPERTVDIHDVHFRFKQGAELDRDSEYETLSQIDAEKFDRQHTRILEWFHYIASRGEIFRELYPFYFDKSTQRVVLKKNLTNIHKLYLYLLMASSLRCFNPTDFNVIGNTFEMISALALKQYFGDQSRVHVFAAGSSSQYTGNKYAKIKRLAQDLRDELLILCDTFARTDTGDEGLDIVGWLPPTDSISGMIIVFGQCACTEDWEEKQSSSAFNKWSQLIRFTARPVNAIFIPFCFRDTSGGWYKRHRIHDAILIDRLRIVQLLESYPLPQMSFAERINETIDNALDHANSI